MLQVEGTKPIGVSQGSSRIHLVPSNRPHVYRVQLSLDHQTRYIGMLDTAGEGAFISAKRGEQHVHRKTNSLGVNLELLHTHKFRWVVVPFCGKNLWTSRLYLLRYGKTLTFGKAGYEAQVFLPLPKWDRGLAEAFEASLSRQCSLFEEAA